jgi:uncharacterized protein (DUF2267 family)
MSVPTLLDMGSNQNSTIVFPIPIELIGPPSAAAIALQVDEMVSRAWHLVGSAGLEALPGRPPAGPSTGGSRSMPERAEQQNPTANVGQPEPTAATTPARRQGQAINYREFISAVQELGAMEAAGEADRAAMAVLAELVGCLSWPAGQNLASCFPRPVRQLLSRRSFESSMNRFSPPAFLKGVAQQERVDLKRAARDTRAVLLALDQTLPEFLTEQVHRELAALWATLTLLSASAPTVPFGSTLEE